MFKKNFVFYFFVLLIHPAVNVYSAENFCKENLSRFVENTNYDNRNAVIQNLKNNFNICKQAFDVSWPSEIYIVLRELQNKVKSGDKNAAFVSIETLPYLDGGELGDMNRAIASLLDLNPSLFLKATSSFDNTSNRYKFLVSTLPLNTTDCYSLKEEMIKKRIKNLEKIINIPGEFKIKIELSKKYLSSRSKELEKIIASEGVLDCPGSNSLE